MIILILGVVLCIAGIVMAHTFFEEYKGVTMTVSVIILVVCCLLSVIVKVPTGHTGVVTTFGKVENYTLDSGIHFMAPWRAVHNMDNRVQKKNASLSCFSSDIQEVDMEYTVNYKISKANAMTIYGTIGKDYYETIIVPNIAESVKIVTASYTAEQLVGMRAELAMRIEEVLREALLPYNIELVSTAIEDIDFAKSFTDAVEAKQVAQQNKLKAQTEAEQKVIEAEAQAEVRKVNADAAAYEILAQADAEAEANRKIAQSLTKELINYTYANTWDGKLPSVVTGDGSIPVIDIVGAAGNGETE